MGRKPQRISVALALEAFGADVREAFDVVAHRHECADADEECGDGECAGWAVEGLGPIAEAHPGDLACEEAEIGFLTGQIEMLDARIGKLTATSATIMRDEQALRAIPGIGPVFARSLIAFIPELGDLSAKAVASLAGLAPHPRQSGETSKRRHMSGGRDGLRSIAFMAALTAARRHPQLAAFYRRLVEAGKPKRLALAAVARKLVVIANAVLKHARNELKTLT